MTNLKTLAETYQAHNIATDSPFADIYDAAYEYYAARRPMEEGEEEVHWMFRIEELADNAAGHFLA